MNKSGTISFRCAHVRSIFDQRQSTMGYTATVFFNQWSTSMLFGKERFKLHGCSKYDRILSSSHGIKLLLSEQGFLPILPALASARSLIVSRILALQGDVKHQKWLEKLWRAPLDSQHLVAADFALLCNTEWPNIVLLVSHSGNVASVSSKHNPTERLCKHGMHGHRSGNTIDHSLHSLVYGKHHANHQSRTWNMRGASRHSLHPSKISKLPQNLSFL